MSGQLRNIVFGFLTVAMPLQAVADCVVLLHGLARTARSMDKIEVAFEAHGYRVANVDYPSRDNSIEQLSKLAVDRGLEMCGRRAGGKIHFVTHSLGGIIVRYYLANHALPNLGRVVMLAPPNNGSEVVDNLIGIPGFKRFFGQAVSQLGTSAAGIPSKLGPVNYPLGIIAGTSTINPILSSFIPGPDDGKVSVESTKLDGMVDFIEIPASHPFIMRNNAAIAQVVEFISTGAFAHE